MPRNKLKVLIVDDTVVFRSILRRVVESLPGTEVVGVSQNGQHALDKMERVDVDLILLDVEMPVLNGLETLKIVHKKYPHVGVVMVSGANENSAKNTIVALEEGALDFIQKPDGKDPETSAQQLADQLLPFFENFAPHLRPRKSSVAARLTGIRNRKPERSLKPKSTRPSVEPPPRSTMSPIDNASLVAIGISTGGPKALASLIPKLPADIDVPIVIVQHMPPMFTASLAASLDKTSPLTVREARQGDPLEPGTVYIAPGGQHMVVRRGLTRADGQRGYAIGLNEHAKEHNCRPSVDVLFRSIAANVKEPVLALIMTGMGEDGCKGVRALKRQGAYCIAQNEATSVVYGMPRAVVEAGLSDEVTALSEFSERIIASVGHAVGV